MGRVRGLRAPERDGRKKEGRKGKGNGSECWNA